MTTTPKRLLLIAAAGLIALAGCGHRDTAPADNAVGQDVSGTAGAAAAPATPEPSGPPPVTTPPPPPPSNTASQATAPVPTVDTGEPSDQVQRDAEASGMTSRADRTGVDAASGNANVRQ